MTYAFLCMGRYNLNVAKGALGPLMSNEDFGIIFAAGTWTYALSFLVNGPLIDKKIGGKNGIIIAALGASLANVALGILTWLIIAKHLKVNIVVAFSVDLFGQYVFPKLRRDVHHQGQGLLVSCARTRRLWRDFRDVHFRRRLFRVRLERLNCRNDKGKCAGQFPEKNFYLRKFAVDATWAVFFVPAVILIFWLLIDLWLIKDTPEEAGFPHLDTCDASSGQMHVEFSVLDLLKKIFASRLMLFIACVELTSGVFRYSIWTWYSAVSAKACRKPARNFSRTIGAGSSAFSESSADLPAESFRTKFFTRAAARRRRCCAALF